MQFISKFYPTYDKSSALSYLAEKHPDYKTFAIIANNYEIKEHVGTITADLDHKIFYHNSDEIGYLYDQTTTQRWFLGSEEFNLPYKAILKETFQGMSRSSKDWMEESVYTGCTSSDGDCEDSAVVVFDEKMLEEQMWEHWVENIMDQAFAL